jgi:hypothetical protein
VETYVINIELIVNRYIRFGRRICEKKKREKKLNPHANTPAVVKMNEINPKYENTRKIHRLLTNQNPGFLYKV